MTVELHLGDCLEIMRGMADKSVDAIITDLPYGTTACKWDEIIPFAPMWAAVKRILKPRGVFVTTASQPFTSKLVMSNPGWFRYEWIWEKSKATGFLDCKKKPLKAHENICVFSESGNTYNPQMIEGENHSRGRGGRHKKAEMYGAFSDFSYQSNLYYPRSVFFEKHETETVHPTQKPVALYEYLIRTYTNEGDTVLDICAGSGTTGIAAMNTGRNAILIEKDAKYFEIIQRRIEQAQPALLVMP